MPDHGYRTYGNTGMRFWSQQWVDMYKKEAEGPHLSCLPESNGVQGLEVLQGPTRHRRSAMEGVTPNHPAGEVSELGEG